MKAAIYARVSSDKQKNNYSITAQIHECRHYCLKNAISVYKEYIDDGYTSKNGNRPAFQEMIKDSKEFDIVLVHTFDRFASNVELSKVVKRKLKENKVNVISITEPIDNSPTGFVMETMIEAFDQLRLDKLAKHVKKAQKYMISEKGLNHGASCFGYNMIDKRLIINETEAKIVRLMYQMYLEGNGCAKIAKYMQKNNIKTRKGYNFEFNQVRKILSNPKYIGKLEYSKEVFDGQHSAIIDNDTFEKVQYKLSNATKTYSAWENGKFRRSKRWYQNFLLGILFCGECKTNFRIAMDGARKNTYYSCGKSLRYMNVCDFSKCFRTSILENEIKEILKNYMQGKVEFTAKINYSDTTKQVLLRRLNKIPAEIERVQEGFINDLFDIDTAKNKKKTLQKEYTEIELELKQINENSFNVVDMKNKLINIWEVFEQEQDVCSKREILKQVIDKIYLYKDGNLEIIFKEI